MYHEIITTIIEINIHDLIYDVTRSQNRSNFEIDISPSIFELQPQTWKDRPKLCQKSIFIMPKKYFHDDDVIDDVTGWPQNRPSILLYKWNKNIFHDN